MKQPDKMASSMLMSTAHKAAAKLLVIPSIPESLVSRMSLMPTKQLNASMALPFWSTKSAFKNCLEQVQLSKLARVACELLRNTMARKVKTTQKLQVMYCNCATHVLLACCVMPGPVMQIPQLFCTEEMSLMKLLTVYVRLQVLAARSPQSSSSMLMQSPEKMLKQALKFLQQLEAVLKLLFSRSNPRSTEYDLVLRQRQLLIWEMRVELSARSSVQVMLLPQMTVEQLYLYPIGTWMVWQKRLFADRSKAENVVREAKRELLKQGSTSLRYIDMPTVLQYGQVVYIVFQVKSTLDRIWADT